MITAVANSNIAIIKYWGNSNDERVIPANNSISFTMDDQLQTKTSIKFDSKFKKDELFFNGKKAKEIETKRASYLLNILRKKAKSKLKAKIHSWNSFPTSAGLASSASGFAALTAAASKSLGLNLSLKELSIYSRFGSGSAARSIFGGAVEWIRDNSPYAKQLVPKEKLKNLRNVIAIIEKKEKK